MSWQIKQLFPADRSAPGAARTMVDQDLAKELGSRAAGLTADAAIVLSELVTNAVLAGSTTVAVTLSFTDDMLSVQVTDDGPGWPLSRPSRPDDLHGRGLKIVAAIADQWGAEPVAGGKAVWATFVLPHDAVPSGD